MVRIWRLGKQSQTMEASMKDHKGPVNCIVVKSSTDDECVSASSDGSCIIWDMAAGERCCLHAVTTVALQLPQYWRGLKDAANSGDPRLLRCGLPQVLLYLISQDGCQPIKFRWH